MTEFASMIESMGFSVAAVCALAWYVNKIHKETLAMQIKQMESSDKTIQEAQEANKLLLLANKELMETNRTLIDGVNVKVDIIESHILQIKKDVEKR